jgi:arylsulfatase
MKFFQRKSRRCSLVLLGLLLATAPALAQDKPNTLVIMTDDVGIWNISAYHRGMMGGRTPNCSSLWATPPRRLTEGGAT